MTSMPDFENDIFISYSHRDNLPLSEGQKGWIESFHRALDIRLGQTLGSELKVWRDPKLGGNDYFADSLMSELSKTAILVTVLSPSYVNSEWCSKELKEFYRSASEKGGVRVDNKSRIIKVVKTYLPREEHPPELQGMTGFEFYQIDPATSNPREFSPVTTDTGYWQKFEDLVQEVTKLIRRLRNSKSGPLAPIAPSSSQIVYLATTPDLNQNRDSIKRELELHGHSVLPDHELPMERPALQDEVRECLKRCQLSVHLIGSRYGIIPDLEESRSIVRLEHELAVERSRDPEFCQLIWVPAELKAQDGRQQKFIDELLNEFSPNQRSDLLRQKLEDLKTVIHDKLAPRQKPEANRNNDAGAGGSDSPPSVYIIHDPLDEETVWSLYGYLTGECGVDVYILNHEEERAQIAQSHENFLLQCDASIIYYGRANFSWMQMKLFGDLRRIAGKGRTQPLLAKAVYITDPESVQKTHFKTTEATVIRDFGDFSPESLTPFIAQLTKNKGGKR